MPERIENGRIGRIEIERIEIERIEEVSEGNVWSTDGLAVDLVRPWQAAVNALRLGSTLAVALGLAVAVAASGCGSGDSGDDAVATARTAAEVVAEPIDEDRLAAGIRLLRSLPEDRRPAFAPSIESFDGSALPSESLIAAHRRRYAAALEFAPHAAAWNADPAIATALRREGLTARQLAELLTQVGCAHQVSHLTDLDELAADTRLNLLRLSKQWDAGLAATVTTADAATDARTQTMIGNAIGELVALDAYLRLLQAVPDGNARLAHARWDELDDFLPPTQLRDQLEQIVEYDFRTGVLETSSGTIRRVGGEAPVTR